jgi:hypothetical protein
VINLTIARLHRAHGVSIAIYASLPADLLLFT